MNLTPHQQSLVDRGFARVYNGRLIPVMRGAEDDSPETIFAELPADLSALSAADLAALAESLAASLSAVAANPAAYVTAELDGEALVAAASEARAALDLIRAELTSREDEPEPETPDEPAPADEPEPAVSDAAAAALADLAAEPEPAVEAPIADDLPESGTAVVASATPAIAPLRPVRSAGAAPVGVGTPRISLTAASGTFSGIDLGAPITDPATLGDLLIQQQRKMGAPTGDRHAVAKARWAESYPSDRRLTGDIATNMSLIASATDEAAIKAEMAKRRKSLTAAGGWCAPVTPYYELATLGTADRPVRNALPGFDASRGGIRHARPNSIVAINDAVGIVTAADDAQGGTYAAKSCQIIDCPDFVDVQANAVYHCLQFGNLTARAFPELVAKWSDDTMTVLARLAESYLLTRIDTLSTQVTADGVELGATATLLPQVLTAAVAMRNRHRMADDTVLRAMFPEWVIPLMVSDVIKSQFDRFTTDAARLTAILRQFNIEPTFYKDTADGRGQVFGAQTNGTLLGFPDHVTWYLYPEGAFIYLDAGTLEIGLVRDSVLNAQNDFQIFGEFFENIAFVGVEALAIDSEVCNSGVVAAPAEVTCPIDFS